MRTPERTAGQDREDGGEHRFLHTVPPFRSSVSERRTIKERPCRRPRHRRLLIPARRTQKRTQAPDRKKRSTASFPSHGSALSPAYRNDGRIKERPCRRPRHRRLLVPARRTQKRTQAPDRKKGSKASFPSCRSTLLQQENGTDDEKRVRCATGSKHRTVRTASGHGQKRCLRPRQRRSATHVRFGESPYRQPRNRQDSAVERVKTTRLQ